MLKARSVGFVAMMMTLFLAACAPTQPPPSGGSGAGTIDATVAGWTLGAADIVVPSITGGLRQDVTTQQTPLAMGSIDASGQLDVTLPANLASGLLDPFNELFGICQAVSSSDPATLATFVPILVAEQNGSPVATLINRVEGSDDDVLRVYVEKPFQATGTCAGAGLTDTFDIDVPAGWNFFIESFDGANRALFADGFESGDTTRWDTSQ
jgi:hypothetical protein